MEKTKEMEYSKHSPTQEEDEQAQLQQEQRDKLVGIGYAEPLFGYYCGMCRTQKMVLVLMSKEDLIKHGQSNKELGHRLLASMLDGFGMDPAQLELMLTC